MTKEFRKWLPCDWDSHPDEKPVWWRNMLDCRFDVAGMPQPLFLAIRDKKFNAYAEGQSIFRISFGKNGEPSAKIHHKFVCEGAKGVKYLTLSGDKIDGKPYEGPEMLRKWIANARNLAGKEKVGIAKILSRSKNVIDTEMGFPADGARMDIVALEEDAGSLKIVFYEAKLFSNASLHAENHAPEVLAQIKHYETWINSDDRRREVVGAYRNCCKLIIKLNEMRYGSSVKAVHRFIKMAAEGAAMEVDPEPRLIIFNFDYNSKKRKGAWTSQEEDLRQNGIDGIRLIMRPRPECITLPETTEEAHATASHDHESQIRLGLKHRMVETSDLNDEGDQEPTCRDREGGEFFSMIDGKKEDAHLHNEILSGGDPVVLDRLARENAREIGFSEEQILSFFGPSLTK